MMLERHRSYRGLKLLEQAVSSFEQNTSAANIPGNWLQEISFMQRETTVAWN
jgi:hypothetical protein